MTFTGLTACATHTVKTTEYTPLAQSRQHIPEHLLLDVGIGAFNPGIDEIKSNEEETTNHEIRVAETRYVSYMLADTLQRSANWGMVRVLPNDASMMDVHIAGTILQSNGEAMGLRVRVSDSTGSEWYTKEYTEIISEFSYDPNLRRQNDPFQAIYNNIANDLLTYRQSRISEEKITEVRLVSELRFAERFAPEAYDKYLSRDRNDNYQIKTLPAENDPLMARIREIRERDFLFVDTVQDYYALYAREMRAPYDTWREQSYKEVVTLREVRQAARRRFVAGTAAVLGGLAVATKGGTYASQVGGAAAVGAGAYVIREGFNKQSEAGMHIEALEELGQSLENELAPRVLTLDDRTITLTGTVEEQYSQWREILADLYAAEVGEL